MVIDRYCSSFEYLPVKARTEYTQNRKEGVIVLLGNEIIKEEIGNVVISYQGTTLSKVSYIISAIAFIAFIAFIGYVIYEKKKKKIE
ncbi:MAG: hypothetical protein HFJ35_05010 [Clostridia bacterium]|nr:hypothetical protein [Clostridia bacterium]